MSCSIGHLDQDQLLPPMCNKCIKRSMGREIISVEAKLDSLFKKIEANPFDLKKDLELASLANKMTVLLDKYEKLCAISV